jgi:hypothetical protein
MSKRARITLNPEPEAGAKPDTEADVDNGYTTATGGQSGSSPSAGITPNAGTLLKVVFARLAALSLLLLWKSRKP